MKTKALFLTLMAITLFGMENAAFGVDVYDLDSWDPTIPNLYQKIVSAKTFADMKSFTELKLCKDIAFNLK